MNMKCEVCGYGPCEYSAALGMSMNTCAVPKAETSTQDMAFAGERHRSLRVVHRAPEPVRQLSEMKRVRAPFVNKPDRRRNRG